MSEMSVVLCIWFGSCSVQSTQTVGVQLRQICIAPYADTDGGTRNEIETDESDISKTAKTI